MSKPSDFCKSSFTLTFAVELLNIEVWHDCSEGWLDLGPCIQGLKLSYQLYPGQGYDLDILIWPHVAKIFCGTQYGWVRTWQFLERRWLAFSIRHIFPVRVLDFRNHLVTITPNSGIGALGSTAKSDKNSEVFIPGLVFGQRRYFGLVLETEAEPLPKYIATLIWQLVEPYIPPSYLDGIFDQPHAVSDIRHQDTVIFKVQEAILNKPRVPEKPEIEEVALNPGSKTVGKKESKLAKKAPEIPKIKYEIKLSGDEILSGAGRIVAFESVGDRPPELGEAIVLLSSKNLPAPDDLPIFFVNIENLTQVPINDLKKVQISELYTRWRLGEETRVSAPHVIKDTSDIRINEHHAVPLQYSTGSQIVADFLDNDFEIELRGVRNNNAEKVDNAQFFGYQKDDRDFTRNSPSKIKEEESDILIAVCKVDAKLLAKGMNGLVNGEYPLYPPKVDAIEIGRQAKCTNEINAIRGTPRQTIVVQPGVILEAQMTMEVSIGLVGCSTPKNFSAFSRMFCVIQDQDVTTSLMEAITEINEYLMMNEKKDSMLTGFALDSGNLMLMYIEGPRDREILQIWELTADYYPKVKPLFNTSSRYSCRLYPDLLTASVPFIVMKMFLPLSALLACPPVYVRPTLPLPCKAAVLKFGHIIAGKLRVAPNRCEMPSLVELRSFKLELCAPTKPVPPAPDDGVKRDTMQQLKKPSSHTNFNWNKRT